MGYSTPKKQLDLKDFLSQPGKKNTRRTFGYRNPSAETQTPAPEATETDPEPKSDS